MRSSNSSTFSMKIFLCTLLSCLMAAPGRAEPINVRVPQGYARGFLVLRDLDGTVLAAGEEVDTVRAGKITSRLTFRFRDGSLDDETTVFTQHSRLCLVSDHHVQRGPSFPHPIDMTIDAKSGMVTIHSGIAGKEKVTTEHMDLPPDVSNGLIIDVIRNLKPGAPETKISVVAGDSKARIVRLAISSDGEETFFIAGIPHKAKRYRIKIELGGVAGAVAPIIGKAPLDVHIWMAAGTPSTMLRAESEFYMNGPPWSVQVTSPTWQQAKR